MYNALSDRQTWLRLVTGFFTIPKSDNRRLKASVIAFSDGVNTQSVIT